MTYDVVFDVSERIVQLGIGTIAAIAVVGLLLAAFVRVESVSGRWPIVLGLGGTLLILQWLAVGAWPFALGAAAVLVAIVVIGRSDAVTEAAATRQPPGTRRAVIGAAMLGLSAFLGLPMFSSIDLTRRLDAGEATVYEGPVTFEYLGKSECLIVEEYRSCYANAEVTPGWNRQHYLVGGIETGARLRISVLDDLIVRLEVARPDGP